MNDTTTSDTYLVSISTRDMHIIDLTQMHRVCTLKRSSAGFILISIAHQVNILCKGGGLFSLERVPRL